MPHIHWVAQQNKLEIPRDKDEFNKREIHEYDGRTHDPDTMVVPPTVCPGFSLSCLWKMFRSCFPVKKHNLNTVCPGFSLSCKCLRKMFRLCFWKRSGVASSLSTSLPPIYFTFLFFTLFYTPCHSFYIVLYGISIRGTIVSRIIYP
jgi:hypothetical protein